MSIETAGEVAAPIETVWEMVADFSALKRWHPHVDDIQVTGTGIGASRAVRIGARTVVEELIEYDTDTHMFGYAVVSSNPPAPLVGLRGKIQLFSLAPRQTRLVWQAHMPLHDPAAEEVYAQLTPYYQQRIVHLRNALGMR